MKKKLQPLNLHRETLLRLSEGVLSGAAAETGSNPHSACQTCTCFNCPPPTS